MSQERITEMKKPLLLIMVILLTSCFLAIVIQEAKAETYTYTFNGVYYDGGDVANDNVGCAVQWVNGSIYYFNLTSDGVTPDQEIFNSSSPAVLMTWNASSALNITRALEFSDELSQEYYICIPPSVLPVGTYAFSVTDFYGMTNPFLSTAISPDGVEYWTVERRNLNSSNTVTFTMSQWQTYFITIECTEGSITQAFTAENVFTIDLPVLAGAFPVSNTTYPAFTAQRLNSSMIGVAYAEGSAATDWLYMNITHNQGSTVIYDYSYNTTGSSIVVYWNLASASLNYRVTGVASTGGGDLTVWIVPVPVLPNSNPWLGVFDWLGNENKTLPGYHHGFPPGMESADIAQFVGAAVITLFLGIGSFRSAGACCVLAWIVSGVMLFLGWYGLGTPYASIPSFTLAGFLSVLIALTESKETVREV